MRRRRAAVRGIPDEWVAILCQIWHCDPEDLPEQPFMDAVRHLECVRARNRFREY